MSIFQDRVAIVTGASRGIGAGVARRLAADGFAVVVNYAGSAEAAASLVDEIKKAGGRAISAQADVSDPMAVKRMFDVAETVFGGVDVLVNNAGIMTLAPVSETDETTFDRTIAINLKGTFNGLREASIRLRDGGRIVSFSSSVVGLYQPTYGVYAATKAYDLVLCEALWAELEPHGVDVLAFVLGRTDTPAHRELMAARGITVPDGLADAGEVARLGLERLPFGPVCNWGEADDEAGMSASSAAQRRERIRRIAALSANVFQEQGA